MWSKCLAIGLSLLLVSLLLGSCVPSQEPEGEWYDVNYQFPTPEIQPVEILTDEDEEIETFDQIWMEGFYNYGEPGEPVLPYRIARILIPQSQSLVSVEVIGEKTKLPGRYLIEPGQVQIPINSTNFSYTPPNREIYQSNNPFPASHYQVISVENFRGYKILLVKLIPIEYIPENEELSYFRSMEISFKTEPIEEFNPLYRGTAADEECVLAMVDNPEVLECKGLPHGEYDMVIITNNALEPYWIDYASWKTLYRGIRTKVYTVEYIYKNYSGVDNQEEIRNFIIDEYNTLGIEYVLLGGDVDSVPVRLFGEYKDWTEECIWFIYGVASDLYYAGLDGDWNSNNNFIYGEPGEEDWVAEVYVGRVPADNSTHVLNFFNKVKNYEEGAPSDYHCDVLFLGGIGYELHDGIGGKWKDDTESKEFPSSGLRIAKLYDPPLVTPKTPTEVTEAINAGTHIINHHGHGAVGDWMGFLNDFAVDNFLTNTDYCLCHSVACHANAFDDDEYDALSEYLLLTAHGAFACVGETRYGGHRGASHDFELEFYDAIFDEHKVRLGPILQDSKEEFAGLEGHNYTYYSINLLGDPSTPLRIGSEVLIHDYPFDDGSLPSIKELMGASPDIFIDSPLDTGYPHHSEVPMLEELNRIYVAVHNKGCLPADNVNVKLYWAALNASWPDDWNYIDEDIIPSIPAGELATAAIDWTPTDIAFSRGCLLATVETTDNPISTHNVQWDNNVAQLNWYMGITFADSNLKAAVREAIGKPTDPICPSDLDGLTSLSATVSNITDLTGLEYCTNLETLFLMWNQISDISPLANLTSLTNLALENNQISDISPLANLTNLTTLGLGSNQISDISPVANLTSLTQLRLYSNHQISDISPLANLTNLTWLDLDYNQISDISPLVRNQGLDTGDEVYLSGNPLSSDSINIYIPQLEARGVIVDY